jgi:hypothetical protein
MDYVVKIDNELADDPILKSDINRAVESALQAARTRFYNKGTIFGRGYDGNAVAASADLAIKQADQFEKDFGRRP